MRVVVYTGVMGNSKCTQNPMAAVVQSQIKDKSMIIQARMDFQDVLKLSGLAQDQMTEAMAQFAKAQRTLSRLMAANVRLRESLGIKPQL